MPSRSPRACNKPGCGKATQERYCEAHTGRIAQQTRPSTAMYGRRWRRYRLWFLAQPENRTCACGCGRLPTQVDHIVPVDGPDDPGFWLGSNHQALTHECHSAKTMREMRKGQGEP